MVFNKKISFLIIKQLFLFLIVKSNFVFAEKVITLGVSAPLTGELSEYGVAIKNGFELAKKEINAKIAIVYQDNAYKSLKAVKAFNSLVNIEKVDLLYNWGEAPLHAVAPLAKKYKIPVLAMSLDERPALKNKYIIRTINPTKDYTNKLIEFFNQNKYEKIGIIKVEDPFFNNLTSSLKKQVELETLISYTPDIKDFKLPITKLKKKKLDILGVYLLPGQVATFYKQASSYNYFIKTFGTDIFESKIEIKNANKTMNGSIYPNILVPDSFIVKYKKTFKNENQLTYAYNSYITYKAISVRLDNKNSKKKFFLDRLKSRNELDDFTIVNNEKGETFYSFEIILRKIIDNQIINIEE